MSDETRTVEVWQTVQVTALPPGWFNLYKEDDGALRPYAAAAMLLQELRAKHTYGAPGTEKSYHLLRVNEMEQPYETRVVFADHDELGHLEPANDATNYAGTFSTADGPIPEHVSQLP